MRSNSTARIRLLSTNCLLFVLHTYSTHDRRAMRRHHRRRRYRRTRRCRRSTTCSVAIVSAVRPARCPHRPIRDRFFDRCCFTRVGCNRILLALIAALVELSTSGAARVRREAAKRNLLPSIFVAQRLPTTLHSKHYVNRPHLQSPTLTSSSSTPTPPPTPPL
jgi:hypothetical protein